MKVKNIEDENFVNYKFPSMTIGCCFCDLKCCHESNIPESTCINFNILSQKNIEISNEQIYNRFINNPISQVIVFAGMEPMLQFDEALSLIQFFREKHNETMFIIYTGYYPNELIPQINQLKKYNNIIMKFGRYIPNRTKRYDEILGINLISDNQYAEQIS